MPFLDKTGLAHLWSHIVARLNGKAEKSDLDTLQSNMQALNTLVGDKAVSEQITEAVSQKSQVQIITWEADD
jgi:hypothetical protein